MSDAIKPTIQSISAEVRSELSSYFQEMASEFGEEAVQPERSLRAVEVFLAAAANHPQENIIAAFADVRTPDEVAALYQEAWANINGDNKLFLQVMGAARALEIKPEQMGFG